MAYDPRKPINPRPPVPGPKPPIGGKKPAPKPSSKFERMNPTPSATKRPAASIPRPGTTGGAASGNAIRDRRQSTQRASGAVLPKLPYMKAPSEDMVGTLKPFNKGVDPKAAARREAMRKAAQKMGPAK